MQQCCDNTALVRSGYISEIFTSFQGEGAYVGFRHLFARMAGCNLRCRYCDTPDSLERTSHYTVFRRGKAPLLRDNPVDPGQFAEQISRLLIDEAPLDALALTGGEPLVQSEFLARTLEIGRFETPVLLETNGVLPQRLGELLPLIDIISMDIKLPSNSGEGAFWDEHAKFLERARAKELYVKILVDQETREQDVVRAAALMAELAPNTPVFLQPILGPAGTQSIDADTLTRLCLLARRHKRLVRVLPQVHRLLGIQ